jgi:hypothetical protein
MSKAITCASCAFYRAIPLQKAGQCMHSPPVPLAMTNDGGLICARPIVGPTDFCVFATESDTPASGLIQ